MKPTRRPLTTASRLASASLLSCFALAACIPAPAPVPAPAPTPVPAPPPAPAPAPVARVPSPSFSNWMDAPQTPGDWRYSNLQPGSGVGTAQFVAGGGVLFALSCLPDRRAVRLQQFAGPGVPLPGASMTVRTEFGDRAFASQILEGSPYVELPAADPFLDAMAFSKGRFAVEVAGLAPLFLPSWPEVTRVIEDCR